MGRPKVSVLLQTYNQAPYLKRAVDSLLAQTFEDFDLLIVDDCSSDATQGVLRRYLGTPRVTVLRNPENLGQHPSINLRLEQLDGEFLLFASGDDVYLPQLLETQVEAFNRCPKASLVHVNGYIIDESGEREGLISEWYSGQARALLSRDFCMTGEKYFELLLRTNLVASHSTAMVRRSSLRQVGRFDDRLAQVGDWDMWMRLALHGDVAYLSHPLVCWRRHESSASVTMRAVGRSRAENVALARKVLTEYPEPVSALCRQANSVLEWGFLWPAWHAYRRDKIDLARLRLEEGLEFFPVKTVDIELLSRSLVYFVREWLSGDRAWSDSLSFLDLVCDNLPQDGPAGRELKRAATAFFWTVEAFAARAAGNERRTRACFVRALAADSGCLRNRGLVSVFVQSIVGEHAWDRIRATWQSSGGRRARDASEAS